MREPWIGSVARRIVASICGGFAREAFTAFGDASPLRQGDTRAQDAPRMEWFGGPAGGGAYAQRARRLMQVLVVGAGVVGLPDARAAARNGHEVIAAERAKGICHAVARPHPGAEHRRRDV